MTNQTNSLSRLGGSPAGVSFARFCTLTLAAILLTGGASAGYGQDQPDAAKPAKPVAEKKLAAEPEAKIAGGYMVHQSLEVGGRYTTTSGSQPMWATLFNQSSGGRVLGQSLEMHSVNTSKTPFFDSLSTYSSGYGGDPIDVTRVRMSKGRWYDFAGSFRRDRNYFDYNLLDSSLLSTATTATPVLVPEPDSLHLFNTVRRNTDTTLTLLPLSFISFRAGFNHGINEGPTYSTLHYAGDVQLLDWFRNASNTYTGGVDVKLAKRTTVSYDQFFVAYKGDTSFQLAGANFTLSNGTPVSLGVDVLTGPTVTCGSGENKTENVINGVANPFCSGTLAASSTAPTRTHFPTEQLRFSSHYWDKVSFNGRFLYSGGTTNVNNFNQTFNGWNTRTAFRQEIQTGGLANGRLATNKRANTNGDFGVVAELNKYLSVSDTFDYVNLRTSGFSIMNTETWVGTSSTSMLTPVSTITPTTTAATNSVFLNQKISSNTLLTTASIASQVKFSGGWRYKTREIADSGPDDLNWHENWVLLGAVIQPSRVFRLNLNFDGMNSRAKDANTPSNTYTREAPNKLYHFRARATVKPAKWINFALTTNDHSAKNNDPMVNHTEHNRDQSFAVTIIPMEGLSLDFNYAHDDVFSETDLCYVFVATANGPIPAGATNAGTCVWSTTNPLGAPTPPGVTPANTTPLYLGSGTYDAPANFFSGQVNYSPSKYWRFNGGFRLNDVNGKAEQLNPLMVPGALQSKMVTPFADMQIDIARGWAWHGNWQHDGYKESGPAGYLPARNTHGDVLTLGVKYAF